MKMLLGGYYYHEKLSGNLFTLISSKIKLKIWFFFLVIHQLQLKLSIQFVSIQFSYHHHHNRKYLSKSYCTLHRVGIIERRWWELHGNNNNNNKVHYVYKVSISVYMMKRSKKLFRFSVIIMIEISKLMISSRTPSTPVLRYESFFINWERN